MTATPRDCAATLVDKLGLPNSNGPFRLSSASLLTLSIYLTVRRP